MKCTSRFSKSQGLLGSVLLKFGVCNLTPYFSLENNGELALIGFSTILNPTSIAFTQYSRKKNKRTMQTNSNIRVIPTRKQHAWAWLSVVALAAIMLLSACGGSTPTTGNNPGSGTTPAATNTPAGSGSSSGSTVMMTTGSSNPFAFSPTTLTIKTGTTVVWKNTTSAPHTVTSDDGKSFDSGTSNPIAPQSGTYSFTFNQPGTYAYHCTFHPYMKATIIVQ